MMKESHLDLAGSFKTLFLALLCASGIGIVQAWSGPLSSAPNCTSGNPGCDAPLHVGANAQTKTGSITAGSLTTGGTLSVTGISTLTGLVKAVNGLTVGSTADPAASALVQFDSTTKGFLPPRMDTTARNNIVSPANGLTIFNTSTNRFEQYTTNGWSELWLTAGTGTTSPSSNVNGGINLTKGCFAINGNCIGGGSGSAIDGPAFAANLYNNLNPGGQPFMRAQSFTLSSSISQGFNTGNAFNLSTGRFEPTIPGTYYLTAHVFTGGVWTFLAICKGGANPNYPTYQAPGCKYKWAYAQSSSIDAMFTLTQQDINSAANNFALWVYSDGAARGDGGDGYSNSLFAGTRIGSTVNQVQNITTTNIVVPPGAVMYFNQVAPCPTGWSVFTELQGRYAVGMLPNGTLRGTAGSPFTYDREDRPAGAHSHNTTFYLSGNHSQAGYSAGGIAPNSGPFAMPTDGGNGLLNGTNAPYIQLLPCKKD